MNAKLILLCTVNVILCYTELTERAARINRSRYSSEYYATVDDIMPGVCIYKYPKTDIRETKKDLESLLSDIKIFKDVVALNKQLREDVEWSLEEMQGLSEMSSIVNLLKLHLKDKCFVTDCSQIKQAGILTSGVYKIYQHGNNGVDVFCDMTTVGGGWTIMQRHSSSTVDFQRTWVEYEKGFGDPSGDLWLGNKILHDLTSKHNYELRIELTDTSNIIKYASYKKFKIGDSSTKYKLTIGDYSGNAGDKMAYHNGMKFTTMDQDNDLHSRNCATYNGAWWLKQCAHSGLNRKYSSKPRWDGIAVATSVMMIRRL